MTLFRLSAVGTLIAALGCMGCGKQSSSTVAANTAAPAPASAIPNSGGTHAVIETDKGTIEFELLQEDSPRAAENFRLLARRGYYNGLTFHRIVKGFMLQ